MSDYTLWSYDASNWNLSSNGYGDYVVYDSSNSRYISIGRTVTDATTNVYISSDGSDWTTIQTNLNIRLVYDNPVYLFPSIAYGNNVYVTIGNSSDGTVAAFYSNDVSTWTGTLLPSDHTISEVIFDNGVFVGVGLSGTSIYSYNGIDWSLGNIDTTQHLYGVIWNASRFITWGLGPEIYKSRNGVDWTTFYTNRNFLYDMAPPMIRVDFTATPLIQTSMTNIQFTNLSDGNPESFLWDFHDNTTSTDEHPIHNFLNPGMYDITLTNFYSGNRTHKKIKRNYIDIIP